MNAQSNTPDTIDIKPRDRAHELRDSLARDWFDNHPFKTAWFNAMSITFPLGEKFFIFFFVFFFFWLVFNFFT